MRLVLRKLRRKRNKKTFKITKVQVQRKPTAQFSDDIKLSNHASKRSSKFCTPQSLKHGEENNECASPIINLKLGNGINGFQSMLGHFKISESSKFNEQEIIKNSTNKVSWVECENICADLQDNKSKAKIKGVKQK